MDSSFDILASQFPPSSPSGSQSAALIDADLASLGTDGQPIPPSSEPGISHYQPDEFRYEGTEARRSAAGRTPIVSQHTLTWEEKKARQRDQNRLAAERSRAKKRKQQGNLESVVDDLESENARMRERIAEIKGISTGQPSLASAASGIASQTPSSTTTRDSISANNAYLRKVFRELATLKATLLEKEMALSAARNQPIDAKTVQALQLLLEQKVNLYKLETEQATIRLLTDNLSSERSDIKLQRLHLATLPALNDGSSVLQEGQGMDLEPWVHAAVECIERSHEGQEN